MRLHCAFSVRNVAHWVVGRRVWWTITKCGNADRTTERSNRGFQRRLRARRFNSWCEYVESYHTNAHIAGEWLCVVLLPHARIFDWFLKCRALCFVHRVCHGLEFGRRAACVAVDPMGRGRSSYLGGDRACSVYCKLQRQHWRKLW